MKYLNIKNNKILLNFDPQTSPQGRPFRLSGIARNTQVMAKWINGGYKNHWLYTFMFTDEIGGFITFEFDYYNNFVGYIKS